jgi:hypothetical protein
MPSKMTSSDPPAANTANNSVGVAIFGGKTGAQATTFPPMALPASALSFLDNRLKVECSNVVKQKELGRGSFGAVYLAEVNGLPSCVKVRVTSC